MHVRPEDAEDNGERFPTALLFTSSVDLFKAR
jgi:hypothetical protein